MPLISGHISLELRLWSLSTEGPTGHLDSPPSSPGEGQASAAGSSVELGHCAPSKPLSCFASVGLSPSLVGILSSEQQESRQVTREGSVLSVWSSAEQKPNWRPQGSFAARTEMHLTGQQPAC